MSEFDNLTPAQRLNQMEIILANTIKLAQSNTEGIKEVRAAISELTERVDRNTRNIAELADMFIENVRIIRQMQSEIRQMQSEIRGIQTENQRIIRHFFGEPEDPQENN